MSDITIKSAQQQIVEARFDASVPDLLRLFYVDDGMSQQQVADRLGVGRQAVLRWMKAYGIPTRDRRAVKEGKAA